jgi:hypothetical protein
MVERLKLTDPTFSLNSLAIPLKIIVINCNRFLTVYRCQVSNVIDFLIGKPEGMQRC